MESRDELYALLRDCTVRIGEVGRHGTGFFVAPGVILTCAHVVNTVRTSGTSVSVEWQGQRHEAHLETILEEYPDLAVLRLALSEHPSVCLHGAIEVGDALYSFGYPDDRPAGDSATFVYEGPTGRETILHKLKDGQVRPGMSGAPLLNRRTGAVCGVMKETRDRSSDVGGRAIPVTALSHYLASLVEQQQALSRRDSLWFVRLTVAQQQMLQQPWHTSFTLASLPNNPFYGDSPSLIGREDEIRRIEEKLRVGNHCSVVGPPGSGKSLLLHTIRPHLLEWLRCQEHEVLSIPCRSVNTLKELQSCMVEHCGGKDASAWRSVLRRSRLRLLILDDLGGIDPGRKGWDMRRWLRSLDDQYGTKLLMASNESLERLFRQDDPDLDSPLAGLDPLPVTLGPLSVAACRQIVTQRLQQSGVPLSVETFLAAFSTPQQPREMLRLCVEHYHHLRRGTP